MPISRFDFSKRSPTLATKQSRPYQPALADFVQRTRIEVPHAIGASVVPFAPWPAQLGVLDEMERERLLVFLKARQLGISWLTCAFTLHQCVTQQAQTWLLFSQGQLEANELIRRVGFLHDHHQDRARFPALVKDNTDEWAWSNGSRIRSLPATKRAGRSFTASGVVLDEFAFMLWGPTVLAAVKPTIDAGGKLFIISSADGNGTPYHQLWTGATSGANGFRPVFLDWRANPTRDAGWRDRIKAENPDLSEADVLREYPGSDQEAFTHAAGLVYGHVYRDDAEGNVTEAADYVPDGGDVYWLLDDGYSAGQAAATRGIDPKTKMYVASAHPRVFLLVQVKADGHFDVFWEDYACLELSDRGIARVRALDYPEPERAIYGPGSAEIRGRLVEAELSPRQSGPDVAESIKELRRGFAADDNGWRRVRIHPRCRQLRAELLAYREENNKPVKAFDHGPDALRVGFWALRREL